ncbi:YD repeat protein [Nitzschia inconspicua]|uniref:YD repeat protein n=1 Tax=Nitzschia inconspicua TaxID=303405 RepID=A0A9K3KUC2_9STRA|nr:YD repeat protein [Nitzschia inconspicua]
MVVAEVPLWVVHSNAPGPAQGATAKAAAAEIANAGPDTSNTDASAAQREMQQRAMESLTLLDGTTRSGSVQKAAIYSVDVHGNKFATGGGDGTVRIWNLGALFPKPKSMIHSQYHKIGPSTVTDNEATLSTQNNYESSGESSMEEIALSHNKTSGTGPNTSGKDDGSVPSSADDEEEEAETVHDLSGLVRRKKDGGTKPAAPMVPIASPSKLPHPHHTNKFHQHRLLCTLSAHTGSSVLAVRFSHNGKYLASAGDDSVVCVYAQQKTNGSNLEGTHVEHWTRIKLCRGHALDAVGLAWAPDDSHLVSCSLDSNTPIIVWNLTDLVDDAQQEYAMGYSNVLCNPYKILGKGVHTSTVKGVTFDPAGTYLASSGDDPSVCVWRAHDDWGLEKRIDAKSGIFRKWNSSGKDNSSNQPGGFNNNSSLDSRALSSQSLFRRLSWSTDGAYICSTNAVVKNKHVASTISREGWAVSTAKSTATGAVNLVGHKQPVVVTRHCPYLLKVNGGNEKNTDEEEPEYATLLALGDKKGFVTVWSTRKSRPVFKIQCSETRCTVTDISWGRLSNQQGDLLLLISLLDGQVVALRFGIPDELGSLLSSEEQSRVFQLRYGIDTSDGTMGGRRLFVGGNAGPKFIENALQFSMENRVEAAEDDEDVDEQNDTDEPDPSSEAPKSQMSAEEIRAAQSETRTKGGKKRVQPLLMQTSIGQPAKKQKTLNGNKPEDKSKRKADTLEDAIDLADRALIGADTINTQRPAQSSTGTAVVDSNGHHHHVPPQLTRQPQNMQMTAGLQATPQIPHSTERIHTVELPVDSEYAALAEGDKFVADCTNSLQVPQGSSGSALPCSVLTLSKSGQCLWKDQLPGTSCSAIAATKTWLVIGTSDGCIQIYGTSPSLGWASSSAFRSHPPFVLGKPVVALHLRETKNAAAGDNAMSTSSRTEMLVVTSDGNFSVYGLEPSVKVLYKGSILPAMTHMLLSADLGTDLYLPKLARIQMTETNRLLLLLSLQQGSQGDHGRGNHGAEQSPSLGAGGSLQGFVYDRSSELWMRVADSRFILSDFYNALPASSRSGSVMTKKYFGPPEGDLSKMDDSVRMGATSSTLQRSRRGRTINDTYSQTVTTTTGNGDTSNDVASRSHCEDRMSCALALGSAVEFEYWFSMYVRTLALSGNETMLRMAVDMLLGKSAGQRSNGDATATSSCWWLSDSPRVLKFDRIKLIRTVIIPEMSKNRALQRVTNEIAVEVNALTPEQ